MKLVAGGGREQRSHVEMLLDHALPFSRPLVLVSSHYSSRAVNVCFLSVALPAARGCMKILHRKFGMPTKLVGLTAQDIHFANAAADTVHHRFAELQAFEQAQRRRQLIALSGDDTSSEWAPLDDHRAARICTMKLACKVLSRPSRMEDRLS